MPLTAGHSEYRATWRGDWLSSIQELADLAMQRATWLNPQCENRHYSFVEYVECYFTDLLLREEEGGYPARLADNLLSPEEAAAASQLHIVFSNYRPPTDRFDHRAILEDPEWLCVVEAAQAAQALLATMIARPEERERLLKTSVHAFTGAASAYPRS